MTGIYFCQPEFSFALKLLQQKTAVAVRVVGLTFLFLVHMFGFFFTSILVYAIIIAYKKWI